MVNESANSLTVTLIDDDIPVYIQFQDSVLTIYEAESDSSTETAVCINPPIPQTYEIMLAFQTEPEDSSQHWVSTPSRIYSNRICSRVRVGPRHDTVIEPTQTFVVTLVSSTGAMVNESANSLTVTLIDDDIPVYIQFQDSDLTIYEAESDSSAETAVCINPPIPQTYEIMLVYIQFQDSVLTIYEAESDSSAETAVCINPPIPQTYEIMLGAMVNESANSLTVTLIDDDTPVVLQFKDTSVTVPEGIREFYASICLSPAFPRVFSVPFELRASPSATDDLRVAQYGAVEEKSVCAEIKITILDDEFRESTETVNLTVSSTNEFPVDSKMNTLVITIMDNDFSGQRLGDSSEIITCPTRSIIVAETKLFTQVVWTEPNGINFSSKRSGDYFPVGTTRVLYGNQGFLCSFNVIVEEMDTIAPTVYNCPIETQAKSVNNSQDSVGIFWSEPFAEDESCVPVRLQSSHNKSSVLPAGVTKVFYNFTDAFGNLAQCIVTVNISVIQSQHVDPFFYNCPSPFRVSASLTEYLTRVTWREPEVHGDVADSIITQTHYSGDYFQVGITNVTYRLSTQGVPSDFCGFSIYVYDKTKPFIFDCPESKKVKSCRGKRTAQWYEPYVRDNSNRPTRNTQTHYPGKTIFRFGTNKVVYTFLDDYGNSAVCSFNITLHRDGCSAMAPWTVLWIIVVALLLVVARNIMSIRCNVLQKNEENGNI
ncbi:Hyalin [Holothuria leucospilota]|uniref:Hyalin n=1 Tax=Holothuria leucospilota TaxID=206669 RepID=A0A9Q1BTG9_HOLLE|nr:Hyalin [Holothuria leucospilota]